MSVRDHGYDPRKINPRSGAHPLGSSPAGAATASEGVSSRVSRKAIAVAAAVVVILLVAIGFSGGLHLGPAGSISTPGASSSSAAGVVGSPGANSSSGGADGASASPSDSGSPSDSAAPSSAPTATIADVAFVPVTSFRSGRSATRSAEVKGIASGTAPFASLVLVSNDAAAELGALSLDASSLGAKLVKVASADALVRTIAKHPTWLGFLRADQVSPAVKALDWGTASLFGEVRVASIGAWPLHAKMTVRSDAAVYDPSKAWTVFAAGDLALDRGAALAIKTHGNNPNYLYSGGTVKITGHCPNCSPFGWDLPYTARTGNAGAVRSLIKGADLAIANMEEVAVKNWSYHPHGTVFTGNPAYLAGIKNAGFDWVSMGNNHVGDFGPGGVLQSMGYLTQYGLLHGGAGANTTAAHKPSIVTVNGIRSRCSRTTRSRPSTTPRPPRPAPPE
jgi:hypothetical protein